MPIKPKGPCNFPRCPKLADHDGYCMEHDKKIKQSYDKERETAVERGYTRRWQIIRRSKLRKNPLCEKCRPYTTLATLVHHRDGNPKNNSWDNLQSMCVLCHAREHAKDFKPDKEFFNYG